MTLTPVAVNELIRKRRAVVPKFYTDQLISKEIIEDVLENANWAPTHRLTQPWRFKVFMGTSLEKLAQYMGNFFKENTSAEQFTQEKYEKSMENPQRSACVIAICMQTDPEQRVPEWEELASVAMAVQNMWLTCAAYGIGSYWSSPRAALEANEFLGLKENERCLGFFYMGYHTMPEVPGKRGSIADKVEWM
jgi:nitroreductase